MEKINLLTQLMEIKKRFSLTNEMFLSFYESINLYFEGYEAIDFREKIDCLYKDLYSIKKLKDDIQKEVKNFYLNIPDEKLPEIIGYDYDEMEYNYNYFKFFEDFEILKEIGYPKIRFIIPHLFEMIADVNWPCSLPAIQLLKNIGNPIVNHTKELFKSNDYELIYRAISNIIIYLDENSIKIIRNDLIRLIELFDYNSDEVSNSSFTTLYIKNLINKEEIRKLIKKDKKMNFVLIKSSELIKDKDLLLELYNLIYELNNFNDNSFLNYIKESNESDLIEISKIIVNKKN